jgi:hypothetical protein
VNADVVADDFREQVPGAVASEKFAHAFPHLSTHDH